MITFLGMPSRTSGEIRGRQVAQAIPGATFTDVHDPNWTLLTQNKVCLFVRTWNGNLAADLKRKGYTVGYDVADQMCGDCFFRDDPVKDLSAYAHPECDFFIVNNTPTLEDLEPFAVGKPIYVVPHHTVNYGKHVNDPNKKVERVGYVGLPEQLSAKDEIEALCARMGVEFVSIHPNTREECVEVMKTIDVGVVFAEADGHLKPRFAELMKRHKPNTKLSNFQSFGIRTVCTPYVSYVEHGDGAARFESTKDGMLESLELMIEGGSLRVMEAQRAAKVGARFHIDEVSKIYVRIASDMEYLGE